MLYLVSLFVLPKRQWDIELSISRIYEDIAACPYEYTVGETALRHRAALVKSRCRIKSFIPVENMNVEKLRDI